MSLKDHLLGLSQQDFDHYLGIVRRSRREDLPRGFVLYVGPEDFAWIGEKFRHDAEVREQFRLDKALQPA